MLIVFVFFINTSWEISYKNQLWWFQKFKDLYMTVNKNKHFWRQKLKKYDCNLQFIFIFMQLSLSLSLSILAF